MESVNVKRRRIRYIGFFCCLLTAVIIFGQLFGMPGEIKDAVTGSLIFGASLKFPWPYTACPIFFHFADRFCILSVRQMISLTIFLNLGWIMYRLLLFWGKGWSWSGLGREGVRYFFFQVVYFCAIAFAVLVPRPMAKLELSDPELLAVDFHSHTNHSWDARRSFTPIRNLQWHRSAGFHAAFITDHNRITGSREAIETQGFGALGIVPLQGEEVSLFTSHWAVLGVRELINNSEYDRGMDGIRDLLQYLNLKKETIVIASLPEYWKYHWPDGLEKFSQWGVNGFEIVNSAPQALDMPPSVRNQVIDFCRVHNLIMTGITDSHGWGSTVYAWNLLRIPGWKNTPKPELEARIIKHLQENRFKAVQVAVRVKAEMPEKLWGLILDPILQFWSLARSLTSIHAIGFLIWLWSPWGIWYALKKEDTHT